ncbi:MAG: kinase [Kiritimatiellia bacterium]|jgi:D-glycero-alpha-D-manno-heptose-7-phosphate kinase
MIISQTPFRISFFGGGTDFPEFYSQYGGATLSTTINKYSYISLHKLVPIFKYSFRASYAQTESVQKPEEFTHPLIRECMLHLKISDAMEIAHTSDLPGRTGLGTSSSFTVGLLHALHRYLGNPVDAETLAREAILIERKRVGDAGGHQDQYAAAYGGLLRLDFSGDSQVAVKRIEISPDRIQALNSRLMLFYTGMEKSAETILREQSRNTEINTPRLLKLKNMVDQAEQLLCGNAPLAEFGSLMHAGWELKKTFSSGISNAVIDRAYTNARAAGATGGKLLGAGGRGFLLLDADPTIHPAIRAALPEYNQIDFALSEHGSRILFNQDEALPTTNIRRT